MFSLSDPKYIFFDPPPQKKKFPVFTCEVFIKKINRKKLSENWILPTPVLPKFQFIMYKMKKGVCHYAQTTILYFFILFSWKIEAPKVFFKGRNARILIGKTNPFMFEKICKSWFACCVRNFFIYIWNFFLSHPNPKKSSKKGKILEFLTTRFIAEKCFSNKTCG